MVIPPALDDDSTGRPPGDLEAGFPTTVSNETGVGEKGKVSASGDHLLAAVSSLLAGFAKNEESTDKAAADAETAMEMVVNEAGVGVGMEGRATAHTATVLHEKKVASLRVGDVVKQQMARKQAEQSEAAEGEGQEEAEEFLDSRIRPLRMIGMVLGQLRRLWNRLVVIDGDALDARLLEISHTQPDSRARLRALEAVYYLSCAEENRTVMLAHDTVTTLIDAIRAAVNGSQEQLVPLATIRNLSESHRSAEMVDVARRCSEVLVAIAWVVENLEHRTKALGALMNITSHFKSAVFAVQAGVIKLVLFVLKMQEGQDTNHISHGEQQLRAAALGILYNLVVSPAYLNMCKAAGALALLEPIVVEHNLNGHIATIAGMHIVGQDKDHSLIVFTDRQKNVDNLVTCLQCALKDRPMFGMLWNSSHLVRAIATAALFEPSRVKMAKLGLDDLLRQVPHKVLHDPTLHEVALQIRRALRSHIPVNSATTSFNDDL